MMSEKSTEIDSVDEPREGSSAAREKAQAQANLEARRRLEDKLERRQLDKQIQEYDFDLN